MNGMNATEAFVSLSPTRRRRYVASDRKPSVANAATAFQ